MARTIKEKINFKYNLKEYFSILSKHKILFASTLFFGFIVSLLFLIDKFLFKIIIDNGELFFSNEITREHFVSIIIFVAVAFAIFRITYLVSTWLRMHFSIMLDSRMNNDLKNKYFKHILYLSHKFHTSHKTGSLISRMNRGSGAVENITNTFAFSFSPLIFNLIVVGSALAFFSWKSALVVFLTSIVFIGYSYYVQHIQQGARLEYNKKRDREKGFISDIFTNVDSIKYFGKEKRINKLFTNLVGETRAAQVREETYYKWLDAGQVLILALGTASLIYFPLVEFINKEITLGTLVFVYTVWGNVVAPLFGFVGGMRTFYRSMADFQDLFEYKKIENDIKDKTNAKNLEIKNGNVEFKNVSFSYGRKKAFSLDDFSLKINKNEKIALVGHSGCGKTTLIKLLYRLYDVDSGEILIDERNIKDFKQESLRGELSIVPQECVLFDDTIFNNIKFSNPKASREEVFDAIRFAQLDKLINNFSKKENTIVGERGVKLSGGEKQRVSIARAILANKKVLVLDEATSSLDSETEHVIQMSLQHLLEGRTSIIIAHRLSTIMGADRIIVMKGGKIIQEGKHTDLIKKEGEYKKLWNLQKGGYIK